MTRTRARRGGKGFGSERAVLSVSRWVLIGLSPIVNIRACGISYCLFILFHADIFSFLLRKDTDILQVLSSDELMTWLV